MALSKPLTLLLTELNISPKSSKIKLPELPFVGPYPCYSHLKKYSYEINFFSLSRFTCSSNSFKSNNALLFTVKWQKGEITGISR